MLSALLIVASLAPSDVHIELTDASRTSFVDMTIKMMRQFGASVDRIAPREFAVSHEFPYHRENATSEGAAYVVEPDATAASYFLALPMVVGGSVLLGGFSGESGLQGDIEFSRVLERAGLKAIFGAKGLAASAPTGPGPGITQNFNEFSDTFLTLAAIAPLLEGPTKITGIAHTRKQETDRVSGMARELRKLGQEVLETEDSLEIRPRPLPLADRPVEIDTYGDHRFAMSFGILGCRDLRGDGRPWLAIRDPGCCAKTFPEFFTELESLRRKSLEA
jgi:3-phosphoshikimate 1-carboxyvinyltransferase